MWLRFKRSIVNSQWSIVFSETSMSYRLSTIDKRMFSLLFLLTIFLFSFSKNDTSAYNPIFRDSVLKTKFDTAKWNAVVQHVDIHKKANNNLIQTQKQSTKSDVFIYLTVGILLILLILRLVFEDFSFSLLEGILSIKKFFIFYKSKKYDSLFAILSIYVLKVIVLALITYIGLHYFLQDSFSTFKFSYFINILFVLFLFFTIKNIIEFIFNSVIDTQETFRAFFLQNLFTEFIIAIILMLLLLVLIYNNHVSTNFMSFLFVFSFAGYVVFNIVRSYQLMGNMRIPYKLHFFLYICAFKILPLLILAKYILNNVIA